MSLDLRCCSVFRYIGADSTCFGHLEENLRWLRLQKKAFDMEQTEDDGMYVCTDPDDYAAFRIK